MKAAREKQCMTYRETTIRMIGEFSSENRKHRREWHCFQVLKENNHQTQNSVSSENTLHRWGQNEDILKTKKTKRIHCQQICSERIAKGSSLDRREMISEGNVKLQTWRLSNRNSKQWWQKKLRTPLMHFNGCLLTSKLTI